MVADLALAIVGIAIVLVGAWLLVRSAVRMALSFGLSRVLIGATVVAFGTSAPEFVVSLVAGLQGSSGVAVGNILGSNVANTALVLGIAAVINPLNVNRRLIRWEIPVLFVATAAMLLAGASGAISAIEGGLMFLGLIAFVVLSPFLFPETGAEAAEGAGEAAGDGAGRSGRALAIDGALLVAGIAALALGAQWSVEGATGVAERLGVSDVVIGVTVIAVGTSLPEVVTSVVAAFKNEHDIAVANVVGSNIFNLFGVIGLTGLVAEIEVDSALYAMEMPALALSAIIFVPLVYPRFRIGRGRGVMLLALYAAFMLAIVARA